MHLGTARSNASHFMKSSQIRHLFMAILSAIIIFIILLVSYKWGDAFFQSPEDTRQPIKALIPFITNLAGVLLFIMSTSRRKREGWKLREYWGDHCFRLAQSFSYLFIILWAWGAAAQDGVVPTAFSPNILGFLVGLYILRVERAIESFGDKFEEMLVAILPRSIAYITVEEKRRQQLKLVYKLDEIGSQYDALRSQINDPGARIKMDEDIAMAQRALESNDSENVMKTITDLTRNFDEVKRGVGEILVPMEELLGIRKKNGSNP